LLTKESIAGVTSWLTGVLVRLALRQWNNFAFELIDGGARYLHVNELDGGGENCGNGSGISDQIYAAIFDRN